MVAGSGTPLKMFQWFNRGVQLLCSVLILAIFSYLLAALSSSGLETPTWVRAVEGISGVAALYTGLCLLLLCCVTGHPLMSFVVMALDVGFFAAFIYVASANRGGAGSCEGRLDTPFGSGDADKSATDSVPSFRTACRLETACFAVSLVAMCVCPCPFSLRPPPSYVRNLRRDITANNNSQFLLSLLSRNRAVPGPPPPKGAPLRPLARQRLHVGLRLQAPHRRAR